MKSIDPFCILSGTIWRSCTPRACLKKVATYIFSVSSKLENRNCKVRKYPDSSYAIQYVIYNCKARQRHDVCNLDMCCGYLGPCWTPTWGRSTTMTRGCWGIGGEQPPSKRVVRGSFLGGKCKIIVWQSGDFFNHLSAWNKHGNLEIMSLQKNIIRIKNWVFKHNPDGAVVFL